MVEANNRNPETASEVVDIWIDRSVMVQASDLHFEPDAEGMSIRMRIDGTLHTVKKVGAETGKQIILRLMVMASLQTHHIKNPQEGRAEFTSEKTGDKPVNLRISTFPTVWGTRAVVRFFHGLQKIPALEKLGYSDRVTKLLRDFAYQSQGMILFAGPAGSGKTTSVYSLLHYIAGVRPGCSIISIEDPVEHSVEGITQVQIGQYAGGLTYQAALKSLLRQDPQVVAIGEVRDADTAQVIMEAALTGHLLVSTIHSPGIPGVVARMLDMNLPPYQLAGAITGIVAQRLVRRLCPACKIPTGNPEEPFMAAGCKKCFKTGYRGRIPVAQASYMTPAFREAILSSHDPQKIQAALKEAGCETMKEDALRAVREGKTTMQQIQEVLHVLE
jgi:type II secretory ATPase GspE/PulE/Tfp pilus assembly ATPase PilB-like protein